MFNSIMKPEMIISVSANYIRRKRGQWKIDNAIQNFITKYEYGQFDEYDKIRRQIAEEILKFSLIL